jgi:ABC-2 type transport system ATP-binding protein
VSAGRSSLQCLAGAEPPLLARPVTSPEETLAVSTTGLTKRFGDRVVVDHLDLAVPTGAVWGFVGPNGAGKTTTIRMLLGLVRPSAGTGTVLGGSLDEPTSYLSRVGALIESPAFYPQLSGRDNLVSLAVLGGIGVHAIEPVLEQVGLLRRADDKYRTYSLGMKQRLGIAAALLPDPELLILDEPTNGLDPAGILEMRGLIRTLAGDGMTVLVSSHLIAEIDNVCDHIVVIDAGRLIHQGAIDAMRDGAGVDLEVRPELAEDLMRLVALLDQQGMTVRLETWGSGPGLVLDGSPISGADMNRLAMEHGIVLAHLAERRRSLEDAFLSLTGLRSGDAGRELSAVS